MIVQKQDKKKFYISVGILLFIFMVFIYFIFLSSSGDIDGPADAKNIENISIVKKYKNLRVINSGLFNENRFKNLRFFISDEQVSAQKGNPNPFVRK